MTHALILASILPGEESYTAEDQTEKNIFEIQIHFHVDLAKVS